MLLRETSLQSFLPVSLPPSVPPSVPPNGSLLPPIVCRCIVDQVEIIRKIFSIKWLVQVVKNSAYNLWMVKMKRKRMMRLRHCKGGLEGGLM